MHVNVCVYICVCGVCDVRVRVCVGGPCAYACKCMRVYMCVWCVHTSVCVGVFVYLGVHVWDVCVQRVRGAYGYMCVCLCVGFPVSSAGKESTCNVGDPGSIPVWGRATGEGIGYPLQYSWVSLVAQLVKNLPTMRRPGFYTWVGKIPWRRERPPTPVFWPGEFHGLYSPWGCTESDTTECLSLAYAYVSIYTCVYVCRGCVYVRGYTRVCVYL